MGGVGRYAPKDRSFRSLQLEGGSFADARWAESARFYAQRGAWFVAVLRARLAIIPQDPIFFTGSLRYSLEELRRSMRTIHENEE